MPVAFEAVPTAHWKHAVTANNQRDECGGAKETSGRVEGEGTYSPKYQQHRASHLQHNTREVTWLERAKQSERSARGEGPYSDTAHTRCGRGTRGTRPPGTACTPARRWHSRTSRPDTADTWRWARCRSGCMSRAGTPDSSAHLRSGRTGPTGSWRTPWRRRWRRTYRPDTARTTWPAARRRTCPAHTQRTPTATETIGSCPPATCKGKNAG
jgi:hypothetical protein